MSEKCHCSVCGKELTKEDYDNYDGMRWECWDDQLTEESDSIKSKNFKFSFCIIIQRFKG